MNKEDIKKELNIDTEYSSFFHGADYGRTYYNQRDPRLLRAGFSTAEKYFLDPQVSACFLITVFSVLNKAGQFESISQDKFRSSPKKKSKRSNELADFLNFTLDRFQGSTMQLKYDLLVSKFFGDSFIESIYDVEQNGQYKKNYIYKKFKAKRSGLWDYVKDKKGNVIGYQSLATGETVGLNKMLNMCWLPLFGNEYGTPDFSKVEKYVKVKEEFLKFIVKRGARESRGKQTILTSDITAPKASNSDIQEILRKLNESLSVYLPPGMNFEHLKFDSKIIEGFLSVVARMDIQIATAMLGNSMTTNQNEKSGSFSLGKVQAEIGTFSFTDYACRTLEEIFNEQYALPLIKLNFDLDKYPPEVFPKFKLYDPEQEDLELMSKLFSALKSIGAFDPDTPIDLEHIRQIFNLPDNPELFEEKEAMKDQDIDEDNEDDFSIFDNSEEEDDEENENAES